MSISYTLVLIFILNGNVTQTQTVSQPFSHHIHCKLAGDKAVRDMARQGVKVAYHCIEAR